MSVVAVTSYCPVMLLIMTTTMQHDVEAVAIDTAQEEEESCSQQELLSQLQKNKRTKVKRWRSTRQTLTEFYVAGVNLALFNNKNEQGTMHTKKERAEEKPSLAGGKSDDAEPIIFDLYQDFDIAHLITGNEAFMDLVEHRKLLERPSLSFYVDKVARKRWLQLKGYAQPKLFALKYASELTESRKLEEEKQAILNLLPTDKDYVAKPTHMTESDGVWIVSPNAGENRSTRYTVHARELIEEENFHPLSVADSLARNLHKKADEKTNNWSLVNVNPGFVIEERFTAFDNEDAPPLEFKIFTIWGRVWVAQMNYVEGQNGWCGGFVHRNGTMVAGSYGDQYVEDVDGFKNVVSWVNWPHLVQIAEMLGENKDMFRTDIFVGVPAGSPSLKKGAAEEERRAAIQFAVSESEIYPATIFVDKEISDEGARLWIAGYKMGNYRLVPNTEVPAEFLEFGTLPMVTSTG